MNTKTTDLIDVDRLFAVADTTEIARVPIDLIDLAPNPRRDIDPEGIDRLARMLANTGQLMPAIGVRIDGRVQLHDGQRRYLACKRSTQLEDIETPVTELLVLLIDYIPDAAQLRVLQAQANQHEPLSLTDQRAQFADCWEARSQTPDADRLRLVCEDLGISAKLANNLLRQLQLPEAIRKRVATRPTGDEISVTLGNELHRVAEESPELAAAIADLVVDRNSHDEVRDNLAGAAHRAVASRPPEDLFAVRCDRNAILTATQLLAALTGHLNKETLGGRMNDAATMLRPIIPEKHALNNRQRVSNEQLVQAGLETLRQKLTGTAAVVEVSDELVDLFLNSRSAVQFRIDEGHSVTYLTDPLQALSLLVELTESEHRQIGEARTFSGSGASSDKEADQAARDHQEARKAQARKKLQAAQRNTEFGQELRNRLAVGALSEDQVQAFWTIIATAVLDRFGEFAVYGAAHTDSSLRRPTASGRTTEPLPGPVIRQTLEQALTRNGVSEQSTLELVGRVLAGALLDPEAVPQAGPLGCDRMQRRTSELLPPAGDADQPELSGRLRRAIYRLAEPTMQPALQELQQDLFDPSKSQESWSPAGDPSELSVDSLDLDGINLNN